MRCKQCGGLMKHIITDVNGRRLYQCSNNLTVLEMDKHGIRQRQTLRMCENIQDDRHNIFNGFVAFIHYVTNKSGRLVPKVKTVKLPA